MTPQEFILAARQREKTAGSGGWQWVFFQQMTAKDREAFDRFLVEYGYPLAFQPGTTEQRFRQMVLGRSAMKRNPPSRFTPEQIGMTEADLRQAIATVGVKAAAMATRVNEKTLARWLAASKAKDFPITLAGDRGHAAAQRETVQRLLRRNPSKRAQKYIGRTIKKLAKKGERGKQAVAIAYGKARRAGFRIPKKARRNPRGAYSETEAWDNVADAVQLIVDGQQVRENALYIASLANTMLKQLARGVHANPAIAVLGNPGDSVAGTLSDRVYEVRYRHAQDGRDYKHPFGPGVRATLLKDGRVVLWHPSKRIWKDFA